MTKPKILIVSTSWDKLGGPEVENAEPTGCWAEEIIVPLVLFKEAGFDVTVSSVKGGEIPMDETSLNPPYVNKVVENFLLDDAAMKDILESVPVADVKADDYVAVFLPGGHGTCWDFPDNPVLGKLLETFHAQDKVVSAVCHGPGGFVGVNDKDGKPIVAGKKVTGFTDSEEYAVAKEKLVPFLLEAKLKELGGIFEAKPNWTAHAVADGKLITGQNPQSSHAVAELVIKTLKA